MILAVTGNTGSGKSAVAALFEEWGAKRIDADEIGRAVWQDDPAMQNEIIDLFGDKVCAPDGNIDRKQLGQIVFSGEEKLRAFDRIVQPVLREQIARLLRDARQEGGEWVLDAALLFEWGHRDLVDRVIAVVCAPELRAERIAARDGISMECALDRVRSQEDEDEKARRADILIRNEGTLEELEVETRGVWHTLLSEKRGPT